MTDLKDIQKQIYRDSLECPRVPWYFSAFSLSSVHATYTQLKNAVLAALDECRKTRPVGNYTSAPDRTKYFNSVLVARDSFLSSLKDLRDTYTRLDQLSFTEKYIAENSDDYAAAVKEKGKQEYLANKTWGNFLEGTELSLRAETILGVSQNSGPYKLLEDAVYTKNGVQIIVPASHSYVLSKHRGDQNVRGSLTFLLGGVSHTVLFLHATYTPEQIAVLINTAAPGLASVQDTSVKLSSPQEIKILPTPTATALGFPVGVSRTTVLYTDASEVAALFGGTVLVEEREVDAVIVDGVVDADLRVRGSGMIILKQYPYGVHLVDSEGALSSYVSPETINYSGPIIVRQEFVKLTDPAHTVITCVGSDVFGLSGESELSTTTLNNTFAIRVFPGDVLSYSYGDGFLPATVTRVSSVVELDRELTNYVTLWSLESFHRYTCRTVIAQGNRFRFLADLTLSADNEELIQESRDTLDDVYSLLSSSQILKLCSLPKIRNDYVRQIILTLTGAKCDVAIDHLKQGKIKEFLALSEISASSSNIIKVYKESL